MQQTSAGGAAEKGGLEFSLANLFKCMCFTHEDPDDSQKQLVNVIFIYFHPFYPFNSPIEALDCSVCRLKIENLLNQINYFSGLKKF